jgi:hypothetical protein
VKGGEKDMFKRILLSLGVLTVAIGGVVFGTQALLKDEVTLGAHTLASGTVDLQIYVPGGSFGDSAAGFSDTMLPGHTGTNHYFALKNNNSTDALDITGIAFDVAGDVPASQIYVRFAVLDAYAGSEVGTPVEYSLTDWIAADRSLLDTVTNNETQWYKMTMRLDSAATVSGVSTSFSFRFTGTQVLPL